MTPRIGVAVTVHGRNDVAADCIARIRAHTPTGVPVIVVDDASTVPFDGADYRFEMNVGIPIAKNKCIELLADAGVEHLFLFDSDAYPLAGDWWRPYVESPEPHLMACFLDLAGSRKLNDVTILAADGQHVAYSGPRGYMLYLHRSVLDVVGGFDPIYSPGMYEHGDLSNRIHHAGLTTWRFADVVDSPIYSLDEHEQVDRTFNPGRRRELVEANIARYRRRMRTGYRGFVPYRPPSGRDVVLTTLLTSEPDTQRGTKWPADPVLLDTWAASIRGAHAVVLADELTQPPAGAELVRVPTLSMNPYYRRWLHIYQHLRDHPEYGWVWCTDGTDVEMLHQPWSGMQPGLLYIGSETNTIGCPWMRRNHQAETFAPLWRDHPNEPLHNAGLLGGDRDTVMRFAHEMTRTHYDLAAERFWRHETGPSEVGDMAAVNLLTHCTDWTERVVTGPQVHSVFRANDSTASAWWRHK